MTTTGKNSATAPALGPLEFARWIWRQLISMRTALLLLLLLAIVSLPGSILPQRSVDRAAVERYFIENPTLAPIWDRLGFFEMFSSVWFGAVYVLLMVSLVGCIIPRTVVYARSWRARPPKTPRRLDRLGAYATFETEATVDDALAEARRVLPRARIDVDETADGADVRAETGQLRELGNLVFHLSIVFVLIGVAIGTLFGYRGAAMVVEGSAFSNNLTQYDEFAAGALFDESDLPPFAFDLESVDAEFELTGPMMGSPRHFQADGVLYRDPAAAPEDFSIRVNHPLQIDGTQVSLVGQGYAPVMRVTDATGQVVIDGPVIFLPEDSTYFSSGVIKAPEAEPHQLGFEGFFLPTAFFGADGEEPSVSVHPLATNPYLSLFAYYGDLGLDDGRSQSVYILNDDDLEQFTDEDGENFRIGLFVGESIDLPDGSTVEFVDLLRFARLEIAATPMLWLPLTGVIVGTIGLMLSLYMRPRRWWIRVRSDGSSTVVEVAALDKVARGDLAGEVAGRTDRLAASLQAGDRAAQMHRNEDRA